MAAVRPGLFSDAVRFSGPVKFAGPVRFARFAGSHGSSKSKIVMKMVAVRAVETPISVFCTEFRCESFRDDDVFRFFENSDRGVPARFAPVRGSCRLVPARAGSVRAGSVRAGSVLA